MSLRTLAISLLIFLPFSSTAQNEIEQLVAEGNRQYARSNRAGILAAGEKLEKVLSEQRQAGLLTLNDNLEYTADLYKLLGDWHYENSNLNAESYAAAEQYFLAALDIYKAWYSPFGYDFDKAPVIRRELAQLYYKAGRYMEAYENVLFALNAYEEAFLNGVFVEGDKDYYDWLDLQMQKAMCLARLKMDDMALAIADRLVSQFPEGSEKYYESLRKKAKILMLSQKEDCAKLALPLYKRFYEWRRADALGVLRTMTPAERQDYWLRMRPFVTDCFQLEGQDPGFIFDVALFSKGLLLQLNAVDRNPQAINTLNINWKDVQKSLPEDGCAIEFIHYEKGGAQKLGAVLVRKKGVPIWVPFTHYGEEGFENQLWTSELQAAIGSSGSVYFSPDGLLHKWPVEYLLPAALEKKKFYRLSSSRQIVLKRKPRLDSALIVGGLRYMSGVNGAVGENDALAYYYLSAANARIAPLPATKSEVERILALRACPSDSLLTGNDATEQKVRSLLGEYSIVNISTHGFFAASGMPQGTDLKPCLTDESLSQTSVILSGAANSLRNGTFNPSRLDGILSAAEISTLDMSKADLVIMSACQSALGEVTGDGVYGIQRGLKNAGAGAMVISLWDVMDIPSAEMMILFHENLVRGMDIHDAFFAARQSLVDDNNGAGFPVNVRKFNPKTLAGQNVTENVSLSDPKFYNAFILIDAL
ncbi:MAG: CHAT domain-containing protein [Bacteroidales bacterium]|nr:CHAT domain-containing protein [Bacteroidales bacterium]